MTINRNHSKLAFIALFTVLSVSLSLQQGAVLDTRDEYWIYMEGPEINEELGKQYPWVMEGKTEYENSCFFNGTVYRQGEVLDIGQKMMTGDGAKSFEAGGWHRDKEVCLNINGEGDDVSSGEKRKSDNYRGGDKGGEWYDIDQWKATQYLRSNAGSVNSDAWQDLWVSQPDSGADGSTGVVGGSGLALEDDCYPQQECEDIRSGIGFQAPFYGEFVEGSLDDDNAAGFDTIFSILSLGTYHNRVQAGNGTGHGEGNTQDQETDLNLGDLENSHIDSSDDEWGLTPRLKYAISNYGEAYYPGQCYGAERVQGVDKNKRQAVYANSFINKSHVYAGGKSNTQYFRDQLGLTDPETYAVDGNWINPDNDRRSATIGGFSCDLTGKDWGYGYQDTTCKNNDQPDASFQADTNWMDVATASTSTDPDENIVMYRWDWTSDLTYDSNGETASHTYSSEGTYTITHKVIDECGESDTASQEVTVTPGVPEGGGSIYRIDFGPDTQGARSIIPTKSGGSYEDMCLGSACSHVTGEAPTSYDANEFVNISGDNMSGTLKTGAVGTAPGTDLCIGQGCTWSSGDTSGLLGQGGTTLNGSLKTQAVTTEEDMCIGGNC